MSSSPASSGSSKISGKRKREDDPKNVRKDESNGNRLAKAALVAAAELGDINTMKVLMNLGVVEEFMQDLGDQEKNILTSKVISKILNTEKLIKTGVAFVPTPKDVKKDPSRRSLFNVTFIPGTDVKMQLMIEPLAVCALDPAKNDAGCYPLHFFCSLPDIAVETVKYLLEFSPADINQETQSGYTALVIAVLRGNYPLVKFLIERGACLDKAPLISMGLKELGSYYPYLNVFSPVKMVFPQLLYYFTPVEAAVFANEEEILSYLVEKGANVHSNHSLWCTFIEPIMMDRRRIVERLLECKADVNGTDLLGTSPLHKAVGEGIIDLVYILMRNGAKVNAKDKYSWTPLHIACLFSQNVSLEMIQLLLDGGAEIEATTEYGFTPLNLAVAGTDFAFLEFLNDNMEELGNDSTHACMAAREPRKEHDDIIKLLLDNGASCNRRDDFLGWTALHWAAAAGDVRTAQLLVSRCASISIKSKFQLDAYQTALSFNRKEVCYFLKSIIDEVPTT